MADIPESTKLLPCPFCGADAQIEHGSDHHGTWFNLGCSRHWGSGLVDADDGCIGGRIYYTESETPEAEAIAAWNTRAAPPAPIAEGVTCVAKPLTDEERKAAVDKWIAPPAMDREAVARIIIGPRNPVPVSSRLSLRELQDIRWAQVTKQEQREALWIAAAILSTLSADAIRQGEGSLRDEIRNEIINTPETADFMAGVPLEAAHQRERWGVSHDGGKTPFDWFWLIGYLAQKAASAQVAGDMGKALHHTISTAAALANWHAQISGRTDMRPGIGPDNGGQKDGSAYSLASALATPASHASDGGEATPLRVDWNRNELADAYDIVEVLRQQIAQPAGSPLNQSLLAAMDAIEAADVEWSGITKPNRSSEA